MQFERLKKNSKIIIVSFIVSLLFLFVGTGSIFFSYLGILIELILISFSIANLFFLIVTKIEWKVKIGYLILSAIPVFTLLFFLLKSFSIEC
ncbi:hypothetical protein EM308_11745 [Flavobacterium gilvum]|uniref:Uncharacterized protein n=1 Tax=Flavobacterium gilvum TaxID=1492737 RepID=A0AAC9N5Q7_9FLAO|nr:hypothetical protein EM308_11745 [Flavobacterium gilvum]KFC60194.1 hypothetical protein FEM08_10160 [Flavobacterium gilvum]